MKHALGIDPGSRNLGLGLVPGWKGQPAWSKYVALKAETPAQLAKELAELFGTLFPVLLCEKIGIAMIEEFPRAHSGNTNADASLVREALGMIEVLLAIRGIPTERMDARTLKKNITGNGEASKDQMCAVVKARLHLAETPKTEHEGDALGLAIIGEIGLRRKK